MRFAWLQGLYLLLVLGGAVLLRLARRRGYFGHSLLFYLGGRLGRASRLIWLPALLEWVGFGFLFVALLDPVVPLAEHEVAGEGLDIVLVIDLSSSMQELIKEDLARSRADDYYSYDSSKSTRPSGRQTRLEAVKRAILDFAAQRRRDRIGIVAFSENAYVVSPLTTDYAYLVTYVNMINEQTLIGEGQTAIGEGLFAAADLLLRQGRGQGKRGKVIVVFTDGENNYGRDPHLALQEVSRLQFKVYFIGVEVEKMKDAPRLISAIRATAGKYYDARDAKELKRAYLEINSLEKGRFLTKTKVHDAPAYFPFALAALLALSCAALLRIIPYFTELS